MSYTPHGRRLFILKLIKYNDICITKNLINILLLCKYKLKLYLLNIVKTKIKLIN